MKNKIEISLSDNIKKRLNYYSIITPELFNIIYTEEYQKFKNIKNDTELNEIINQNLIEFETKMENIYQKNNLLESNSIKAIAAINNQDTMELEKILLEVTKIKDEFKSLKIELYQDDLTKSYNMKWLNKNKIENNKFSINGFLIFLDLNDFKTINDNYGHLIGDKTLIYFSKYIQNILKNINTNNNLIRYGGDEFLILFENSNLSEQQINNILCKIKKNLKQKKFKTNKLNQVFNIDFSYGLSEFKINDDFQKIIEIIDQKMYKNKKEDKELK